MYGAIELPEPPLAIFNPASFIHLKPAEGRGGRKFTASTPEDPPPSRRNLSRSGGDGYGS